MISFTKKDAYRARLARFAILTETITTELGAKMKESDSCGIL
jgi:hypothetical protein